MQYTAKHSDCLRIKAQLTDGSQRLVVMCETKIPRKECTEEEITEKNDGIFLSVKMVNIR